MKTPIAVVLVEAENPDNIGAAARAMKNMGFSDLRLVQPPEAWKERARKMALEARDVLEGAKIFSSLKAAVRDSSLVIGTTRRQGARRGVFLTFDEALEKIRTISQKHRSALVFGKESKGLDNQALGLCDALTTIPSSLLYPSLNLAQAVMVCTFSLFKASSRGNPQHRTDFLFLPKSEIHDVLRRFRRSLKTLDYDREGNDVTGRIVVTLHGLIKRGGLIESEAQMLKGLSRRIQEKCKIQN